VRPGDVILIDRHAGEKGLAFLMDTEQRPSYVPMPFVASHSMQLATAEVRG
jgi:S-adenosylmethionine synthetase